MRINFKNIKKSKLAIVCSIAFSQSLLAVDEIPFAEGILESITSDEMLWDQTRVETHIMDTVNDPGGDDNAVRDNAAKVAKLSYVSEKVETVKFKSNLDLTNITRPVRLTILVDDEATLSITGEEFNQNFELKGSALWKNRSVETFSTVIPPNKVYELNLTYKNTTNLSDEPEYENLVDRDGINIYLAKIQPGEWYKEERNVAPFRKIGEFENGDEVRVNINYTVCWEAKELADGTFRVRNLEWILTKRPQNQLITEAFTLTDVVSPDEPMVVGANSTWSVTDIHNTSGGETDVMVIVDRAGNSTLQVRSGAINSYLAGHPLPEGVTDTDRSIHWTLGEIQMPMHSFRIDKEGDLLVFLEHGHFINYRVNAADGSETIVRTGFDATPAILSRYRVQFPEE